MVSFSLGYHTAARGGPSAGKSRAACCCSGLLGYRLCYYRSVCRRLGKTARVSESPPELAPQDISKRAGMEDRGIFPRVILVRKAENTGVNKPGPERVMDPYFCLRWMAGRPQGHHS